MELVRGRWGGLAFTLDVKVEGLTRRSGCAVYWLLPVAGVLCSWVLVADKPMSSCRVLNFEGYVSGSGRRGVWLMSLRYPGVLGLGLNAPLLWRP